jgi:e3 binding domain
MASQRTKSRRSNAGRTASEKTEKYRFAQNLEGERTVAEREYTSYALGDPDEKPQDADVLLDVPVLKVDSLHLEVDDLDAHVALKAKVLDLVTLNVGVDAQLGKVRIDIKGVEAQALLKVRLDHVAAVVDRVLTTIDRNPELLDSVGRAVEDIGSGAGHTLGETGEAVEDVGEGAGQAVSEVGQGAGQGVGQIGEGAGQAVGEIGQGAAQAVGDVGQGAGQAVGNVDQAAGQAQQLAAGGASGGQVAKAAARTMAEDLKTAASQEAKQLSVAATRKVREMGERRRQRRSGNATDKAAKLADELGVDLDSIEGTGADGRITVKDVRSAAGDQA